MPSVGQQASGARLLAVPQLSIEDLVVAVEITDRTARVRIDQTVSNQSGSEAVVSNAWPVPLGMDVSHFRITIGEGGPTEVRQTPVEEANRLYRAAAESLDDPRVVRYLGRPLYRGPEMTVLPFGRRTMRMEYEARLPVQQEWVRFHHPLSTNGFSTLPIRHSRLSVSIRSSTGVGSVYSPTHDLRWKAHSDGSHEGSLEERDRRIETDLQVFYAPASGPIEIRSMASRRVGFGGSFVVTLRPGAASETAESLPRDVVYVLDTSGSMKGVKMSQARSGLNDCLARLNRRDRFGVIWYGGEVHTWRPGMSEAQPRHVNAARRAVSGLRAAGKTNIHAALQAALELLGSGTRPASIVFLTDGLPTAGVTSPQQIKAAFRAANRRHARLFAFGVGYDVNVPLLDSLTSENHGDADYVRPGDNLAAVLTSFAEKQADPVMTNVKLAVEGVEAVDVIPKELPDLFKGGEVVAVGRYVRPGRAVIRVSGVSGSRPLSYQTVAEFPAGESSFDFTHRLWAQKRIGTLLDEIRLKGPRPELVQQVTELSREFAIVTDYTRDLLNERVELDLKSQSGALSAGVEAYRMLPSGAAAASQSVNHRSLRTQNQLYQGRYRNEQNVETEVTAARQAGAHSQFMRGGYWTDPAWKSQSSPIAVRRFSAAYWEILNRRPDLAEPLSAGKLVRLRLGRGQLEIGDTGQDALTPAQRNSLFSGIGLGVDLGPGAGSALAAAAAFACALALWRGVSLRRLR